MAKALKKETKLFTHTDLDGVGCFLVLIEQEIMYPADMMQNNVEFLNYNELEERISRYIDEQEYINYNKTYITDLSLSEELGNKINKLVEEGKHDFVWVDHHKTSLYAKDYNWTNIMTNVYNHITEEEGRPISATMILFNSFIDEVTPHLMFDCIDDWDTWQWVDSIIGDKAKKINDLLYILGREEFVRQYASYYDCDAYELLRSPEMKLLLKVEAEKKKNYFKSKSASGVKTDLIGRKVFVALADQYISELGSYICEYNKDIDICILINIDGKNVSYRTGKKDIDCCEFAKNFGGGGHPAASGSQFTGQIQEEVYKNILDTVFNK